MRLAAVMRGLLVAVPMTLAACDPAELADKAVRRAAEQVVLPVVAANLPAGPAQTATACILDAASPAEQQQLARDLGVEAGTRTVQTVRTIAARPGAQGCIRAAGLPPVRV